MMDKKLRKHYRLSKIIINTALIFWLLETIVFLFIYGWHYEAIGIEKYFDRGVSIMLITSVYHYIKCLNIIIKDNIYKHYIT